MKMKQMICGLAAVMMSLVLTAAVWAGPEQDVPDTWNDWTGDNDDGGAEQLAAELAELFGETISENNDGTDESGPILTPEEASVLLEELSALMGEPGSEETAAQAPEGTVESADAAAGESEGADSSTQEQTAEEPGIPKDEPVSTTGTAYGYQGTFDINTASTEPVNLTADWLELNGVQMITWGRSAIQNSGSAYLFVRNSYIRGETSVPTVPLDGNPGNLLVAGNIRTTLGMGNSQSYYINSTVVTRNWAALSTDAAQPALQEGLKELSLYAYGSEAIAIDGGYGAYSDLFCNVYSYGSHFQSAEIGIISGSYGKVQIGTIADGEEDPSMAAALLQEDMDLRSDKQLGSFIEAGRNALMIHSVNLPPYWEYEGYSQKEIPLLSATVTASHSDLRTNISLNRQVEYEPQKQAYINHTAGSVILIKSTNAQINLDSCELAPDPLGTGYLIQTVFNNDVMFMNSVPDGEDYPGIRVTMRDMGVVGDVAHEDYQRDFQLLLEATQLDGALNEYDCAHWNQVSAQEGFSDYCLEESYQTHHGLKVTLKEGSIWNVTAESHLSRLAIGADSTVNGVILVNGEEQVNAPGSIYEGNVVVMPAAAAVEPQEETTEAWEEETTEEEYWYDEEEETEHVHNWQRDGGSPGTCTENGVYGYSCFECGAYKTEPIPDSALGHDWVMVNQYPADCIDYGYKVFECSRCGETYIEIEEDAPPLGHDLRLYGLYDATCTMPAAEYIICTREGCNYERTDYYGEPLGHDYSICYPTPGAESLRHTWECSRCSESYTEPHTGVHDETLGQYCADCGYVGAFGADIRVRALLR